MKVAHTKANISELLVTLSKAHTNVCDDLTKQFPIENRDNLTQLTITQHRAYAQVFDEAAHLINDKDYFSQLYETCILNKERQ